ncbi:CPBP family intramembrane glutamic endopeptidase [Maribacter aestuarii]|uniref:CPBP family intramembrane glutamic endopeptidase n=1 Tax=Maribacter aestuarii TaxID=1130723 RepID=UPI003D31B6E3
MLLNLAICAPIYQIILSYFNQSNIILNSPFDGVYDVIAVLVIAPFFEETIFKGIFLDGLLKKNRPMISILFTAFLFSILHLNPYLVSTIFLFAVFTGWLYYRTRNLALVIWVHFLHNLIGSIEGYELQGVRAGFTGLERTYGGNSIFLLPIFIILFLISFYMLYKSINSSTEI